MTSGTTILLVCLFVMMDVMVVGAVLHLCASTVGGLAKRFPEQPLGPAAVRREFQSIHVDLMSMGFSVHIAVDERFLHIQPAWLMRRMGMRTASIPWDQIQLVRRGTTLRMAHARVGSTTLRGPDWALAMADPDART